MYYVCIQIYFDMYLLFMIKARIRWCTCRVENILTLGKLLSLWFCFLLHSILFLISQIVHTKIISSYELARPIMGTIFLVYICMSFGMYVCLSWSKKRRRKYVGQTRACSKSVLCGKIRPVPPVLLEKWFPLWGERAHSLKLFCMCDKRFEISKTK